MEERKQTLLLGSDAEGIAQAARLLREGELVGIPTETVYGLAADALNGTAAARIFAAKGRPQDNPLIGPYRCPQRMGTAGTGAARSGGTAGGGLLAGATDHDPAP